MRAYFDQIIKSAPITKNIKKKNNGLYLNMKENREIRPQNNVQAECNYD